MKKCRGTNVKKGVVSKILPYLSILVYPVIFLSPMSMFAAGGNASDNSLDQIWSNPITGIGLLVLIVLIWLLLLKTDALNRLGISRKKNATLKTGRDAFHPVVIKRGFDIKIQGKANPTLNNSFKSVNFAIKPPDFHGMSPIPKCEFEIGDQIMAGSPLFFDKKRPEIIFTAPVSGEIIDLKRGDKRKIEEIIISADKEMKYKDFGLANPVELSREKVVQKLVESGVWPLIKQRPFDLIPAIDAIPAFVYVSTFATAPLAPDSNFIFLGCQQEFITGIGVLNKLSNGQVK